MAPPYCAYEKQSWDGCKGEQQAPVFSNVLTHGRSGHIAFGNYTLTDQNKDESGPSAPDMGEAIDKLYDVALDPGRYEALLDQWEELVGPMRSRVNVDSPRLLDDPQISAHFRRASVFLDRTEPESGTDNFDQILSPFEKVAAFVVNADQVVVAVNDAAQGVLGLRRAAHLQDLPVNSKDISAIAKTLRELLSGAVGASAVLRVRAEETDRLILLRLQRCNGAGHVPLILAASSEIEWPEGFGDILRRTFGLTSAEAGVVRGLVECCSVKDIAEQRGRSVDTVRVQIKSVLAKTETRSQLELVRLALSVMDMTAQPLSQEAAPRHVSRGYQSLEPREYQTLKAADGRRVDYLRLGDPAGRPVLFLPFDFGLVRWPAEAEADAARRGLRIIVPLRPGYGSSDPLPKSQDYDAAVVSDIVHILDTERVASLPVISCGDDLFYATRIALAAPGRISAIIGCAGSLPLTRHIQYERMSKWHRFIIAGAKYTPQLLPFMVKAGFMLARKIGKRGFVHAVFGESQADIDTFEKDSVYEAIVVGSDSSLSATHSAHDAFARQQSGGKLHDWSGELLRLNGKLPVILVNGLHDPQVPPETLAEFQHDYDWIDFRLYKDAGQLIFFRHWRDVLDIVEAQ